MNAESLLKLSGEVELTLVDKQGRVKKHVKLSNLVVNVGKAQVAGLINGIVTTPFKYIAIGVGSASSPGTCTAPSPADTALGHEVARVQAMVGRTTTNTTNDTATWSATFSFTSSYSICEAGIFDASSGGNMLARQTFPVVNVMPGDTLTVNWKVVVQ